MNSDDKLKIKIQKDIGSLSEVLSLLCSKYSEEPLLDDAERIFLSLSVHVGKALDISLQ